MKSSINSKSTVLAIAFITILTIVATSVSHAQNNTENPIFATSGPNILERGTKLWHNELSYEYLDLGTLDMTESIYGFGSSFRIGIGHNCELGFKLEAGHIEGVYASSSKIRSEMLVPSASVKVGLFEGKGVLPQVAFQTEVAFPVELYFGENSDVKYRRTQPTIGLEFRNRIGNRFNIDYSLGYSLHSYEYATWDDGLRYSLAFNALITDRLALGLAIGKGNFHAINDGGSSISNTVSTMLSNKADICLLYQATPNVQFSIRGNIQIGDSMEDLGQYSATAELTGGLSWKF